MTLCSQLFRHLAKFIICLYLYICAANGAGRTFQLNSHRHLRHLKKKERYMCVCAFVCVLGCCLEPLELKIAAQLNRIAANSMKIRFDDLFAFACYFYIFFLFSLIFFHCVNWLLSLAKVLVVVVVVVTLHKH